MNSQLDCVFDPESALVAAFQTKNLTSFIAALDRGANAERIDEDTCLSVFDLACQTPKSEEFIRACLQADCDPKKVNEELDKYPIHFAAESLDANNLLTLLEADPTLVNQKYDDNTPLHIIVESVRTENFDEVFDAIKVLLKFQADINCPEVKGHTPFSLLLKKLVKVKNDRKRELLDYIIKHCAIIDVDTYRKGEARTLLEKDFPDLLSRFPRKSTSTEFELNNKEQNLALLRHYLESDEQKFKQALNTLKNDSRYENEINAILDEGVLLDDAIISDRDKSFEELLKLNVNVNRMRPGSTYTPIEVACQRGNWKILQLLSGRENVALKSSSNPLLHIIVKNLEGKKFSEACDYYKCFDILINNSNIDVNAQDANKNTALHYAVRYKNDYAIKKLLEKSAYIGTANIFKALPIRDIAPDVLENYFDSCITTNGERPGDDEYEIRINYSCLVPSELRTPSNDSCKKQSFAEELSPIQYMADTNELKYLIQHPLISSFLFLKWFRLSPIFYTNLVCYSIYCVSLITYIVFCLDESGPLAVTLKTLSVIGAIYVFIREFIQLLIAPINYVKSPENYLEVGLIVLTWTVLFPSFSENLTEDNKQNMRNVVGAITIMFAAAELSLLVGSLPFFSISTHMVMLKTVSMSFLRGLALYSIILVAFAFSFFTLFKGQSKNSDGKNVRNDTAEESEEDELNRFVDPGRAIIKTIVMLTGEFEASSIDFNQNALSYLIFVLFLFFMSIVVLNLLNGLAVSDTQLIKSEAELNNWLERARLLTNYEKIMLGKNNNQCQNFLIQLACMKKGTSIISIFPQFLPLYAGKHSLYIRANAIPPNQMFIPTPATNGNMVESGEMYPLNSKRVETAKRLEGPVKALSCCFAWKNCAVMDKKIVKFAKKVLDQKERQLVQEHEKNELKQRIDKIELKLNQILSALQRSPK